MVRAQKGDSRPGHRTLLRRYRDQDHGPGHHGRPGQAHNPRGTAALIERLSCRQLPADRALDEAGIEAVIPPDSSRRLPAEFHRDICTWHHRTGTFLAKLKEYRRIALCRCKTDPGNTPFIAIAATVIHLR